MSTTTPPTPGPGTWVGTPTTPAAPGTPPTLTKEQLDELKLIVAGWKRGNVPSIADIDQILIALNMLDPATPPMPPTPETVGKIGSDGDLHAFKWNPVTGLYDIDEGLAEVSLPA
jgi:hypothetical protein